MTSQAPGPGGQPAGPAAGPAAAGQPADPELERAVALELELRLRVAELVTEQYRTREEVARLEQRAQLPGADAALGEAAARYRTRIRTLERDLVDARARLRSQEGAVAALRAERDLGPATPDTQADTPGETPGGIPGEDA